MKDFIKKYADKVKNLILNGEEIDLQDLSYKVEQLEQEFYRILEKEEDFGNVRLEGTEIVSGLITKLKRLYPIGVRSYNRDYETHLAQKLDLGFGYEEKPCPYEQDEETLGQLQKNVTLFLAKRSKNDPTEDDPEFANVLLTGESVHKLSYNQMNPIIGILTDLTHAFVNYIEYYKPEGWHWFIDCIILSQYIFEKIAELTYKVLNNEDTDDWSYNIREAFTYYEPEVSEELLAAINNKVGCLEDLVSDTIQFIENKDIDSCDFEVWLRPIFFNIGVQGMQFTLEQHKI